MTSRKEKDVEIVLCCRKNREFFNGIYMLLLSSIGLLGKIKSGPLRALLIFCLSPFLRSKQLNYTGDDESIYWVTITSFFLLRVEGTCFVNGWRLAWGYSGMDVAMDVAMDGVNLCCRTRSVYWWPLIKRFNLEYCSEIVNYTYFCHITYTSQLILLPQPPLCNKPPLKL